MSEVMPLATLSFETPSDWEAWLANHHANTQGLWLKIAKSGTGIRSVTYAEALDIALCFGWIDGQKSALDDQHWLQKFTPRRPKSGWSKVNRQKVEALIAAGKMRPAGQHQVDLAKADGRWDVAYDSQSASTIPPDFQREMERYPGALTFFQTLDSANRYAFLYRIQTAKRPETRAARIQQFATMLSRHEKIHT